MKRFLTIFALVAVLVALPLKLVIAEEGPVTFYGAFGGTAALDEQAAITSASVSLRFGIKTYLNGEGTWRLITEYNSIDKPLLLDETSGKFIKSLDVGAERIYWLGQNEGFLAHSALVIRGSVDFELNREDNDNNLILGFGWLKKLSVDMDGNSLLSVQGSFDMRLRDDEKDDIAFFVTLNLTPPMMR